MNFIIFILSKFRIKLLGAKSDLRASD